MCKSASDGSPWQDGHRPPAFARLAGDGLRVVVGTGTPQPTADLGTAEGLGVPELAAEAALLQARLDWFQTQLARLGERGSGAGPQQ